QHRERAHARRDQRRGASEPAAGGCVGCDVDIDPRRHPHPLDRGLGGVDAASAEEPPSPLPGGASDAMSTSIPVATPIRSIAALGRSITPSYTGPCSRWYPTRRPRYSDRLLTWRS